MSLTVRCQNLIGYYASTYSWDSDGECSRQDPPKMSQVPQHSRAYLIWLSSWSKCIFWLLKRLLKGPGKVYGSFVYTLPCCYRHLRKPIGRKRKIFIAKARLHFSWLCSWEARTRQIQTKLKTSFRSTAFDHWFAGNWIIKRVVEWTRNLFILFILSTIIVCRLVSRYIFWSSSICLLCFSLVTYNDERRLARSRLPITI